MDTFKNVMMRIFAVIAALMLLTGCVNVATSQVDPSADLNSLKSMYVKQIPEDKRGVNELIATKLRSKGVKVTTGVDEPKGAYDAFVTYADKWMWDITMYLLQLTVTVRDPKTDYPMASANSLHGSLTRLSPTEMVAETLNNIYNGKVTEPEPLK